MEISLKLKDKGDRLVAEGKVKPIDPDLGRYEVQGDHGTYKVTVSYAEEATGWCNCFATKAPCSHLYAASVFALANPVQRRLHLVSKTGRELGDPFEGLN